MSTAILSFLGIIIGAMLQYFFTRYNDGLKHHRELRTKAYTDYLKCVSDHACLRINRSSIEGKELAARTADVKCRICLYGAPEAITAFADFERLGASMITPEQCEKFTEMVAIMRKDSASKQSTVILKDLQVVLLGDHENRA